MHILSPVTDNFFSWISGRRNESKWPDPVSNPGSLTFESKALPTTLRYAARPGPALESEDAYKVRWKPTPLIWFGMHSLGCVLWYASFDRRPWSGREILFFKKRHLFWEDFVVQRNKQDTFARKRITLKEIIKVTNTQFVCFWRPNDEVSVSLTSIFSVQICISILQIKFVSRVLLIWKMPYPFRVTSQRKNKKQVFQLLHNTRKTFQVQSIELMYFSFNNIYDIWDEFRVN